MIFIPLPFVMTLFLVLVLVQLLRRNAGQVQAVAPFALLIAIYAVQSVLVGLRWGYGISAVGPFQIVLAMVIAPLAWVSFHGLTLEEPRPLWRAWPHLFPAALVILLLLFWRDPLELAIQAVFTGYGMALLWLARGGRDVLVASRLDGTVLSYRALIVAGLASLGSVVSDILISLDMAWNGGVHAGSVVAAFNIIGLLLLASAASAAGLGQTPPDDEADARAPMPSIAPTEDDAAVAAAVDRLMAERALYRDADLNLGRIARRLGMPARRVSTAVNRIHGKSVSLYVNDFRVAEARRLLADTDEPVTRVMFEAGFQTKSNFNREFLRATGMSPSAFRQAKADERECA